MKILSEISAGELLDKITILEIKIDKIKNEDDKKEVLKEYKSLKKIQEDNIEFNEEIKKLYNDLKQTNSKLWEIEDKLRVFEKEKKFDNEFIKLARGVYFNNDDRSKIKLKINQFAKTSVYNSLERGPGNGMFSKDFGSWAQNYFLDIIERYNLAKFHVYSIFENLKRAVVSLNTFKNSRKKITVILGPWVNTG